MSWEKVTRQDPARDKFMQNMKNIGVNEPSTAWLERLKQRQANGDWKAAKARFMATCKALTPHKPSNKLANRILKCAEAGEDIPPDSLRMAREATR